jgi:hypothetical protein
VKLRLLAAVAAVLLGVAVVAVSTAGASESVATGGTIIVEN